MPDERGGSWPVAPQRVPDERAMPNPLRQTTVSRQRLKEAFGRPWREAVRAIVAGGGGDPAALAAASGFTSFSDTSSAILQKEVGNDLICVVERVRIRPVSTLGFQYLTVVLTDGGHDNDTTPYQGRVGNVMRIDIPLPVNAGEPVDVEFQCAGGTLVRLWVVNADPIAPHAVVAEMSGRIYQAEQFRIPARPGFPGAGGR